MLVVTAGKPCIHLIALMYSSCCVRGRDRLGDVNEGENQGRNIVTYHSFLTMTVPQASCLSVRVVLEPIDAKDNIRARAPTRQVFIVAVLDDCPTRLPENIQGVEVSESRFI